MNTSPPRPARLRIADELARPRTLDSGAGAFVRLHTEEGGDVLLLGIGPEPTLFPEASKRVIWLECPAFERQMPPEWREAIPPHWRQVSMDEAEELSATAEVWQYRAAPRLFPSFWGPFLGRAAWRRQRTQTTERAGGRPPAAEKPLVLLAGKPGNLLTSELVEAFGSAGFAVATVAPDASTAAVRRALQEADVSLFFAVNFQGLDAQGETFHLLRAARVPVAAWLVDNPWNVVSQFSAPWWREALVLVTDASFVEPLRRHGVRQAEFLPLAAWDMPVTSGTAPLPRTLLSFVGHSAFPHRESFFAGLTVPEALWAEAEGRLGTDSPPHVHWWAERLELTSLWPGLDCRRAGFGAEQASRARRVLWLQACAPLGLTVYGDAAWGALLPAQTVLHPEVDYYTALGAVYAESRYSLNVTSLQLPAGLTQRHFDVWQAGGFLLSDATPGLNIFPKELTGFMSAATPQSLPALVDRLEKEPGLWEEVQNAWQRCIRNNHTYHHRVQTVLQYLSGLSE